jgi:TRAP-type mannitol/chloroaromatic compound transport system permease small subunit
MIQSYVFDYGYALPSTEEIKVDIFEKEMSERERHISK